jgi:hypothetical protein
MLANTSEATKLSFDRHWQYTPYAIIYYYSEVISNIFVTLNFWFDIPYFKFLIIVFNSLTMS